MKSFSIVVASLLGVAIAAPTTAPIEVAELETRANNTKRYGGYVEYIIKNQGDATADYNRQHAFIGALEVKPGGSLTLTKFHSQSSGWTVGGDLGLTFQSILKLGVSGSTTQTTLHGDSEGASYECPKDGSPSEFTCNLMVTPKFIQVNGRVNWHESAMGSPIQASAPYTAMFPATDNNDIQRTRVELCLCPNPNNMIYPKQGSIKTNCPGSCGN